MGIISTPEEVTAYSQPENIEAIKLALLDFELSFSISLLKVKLVAFEVSFSCFIW